MNYLERNRWVITLTVSLMIFSSGFMANELGLHVVSKVSYVLAGVIAVFSGIRAYFTNTLSSKIMQYLVLAVVLIAALATVYKILS